MAEDRDSDEEQKKGVGTRQSLASRMKGYEERLTLKLDPVLPFIVRLDGHGFSKFTRNFNKPYDLRIHQAMILTTNDLLNAFLPTAAYTESDEISLIFPPAGFVASTSKDPVTTTQTAAPTHHVLPYNGKVIKIVTLLAGYCSARFNHHLRHQTFDSEREGELIKKADGDFAYFDARVFSLPSISECLSNIIWRSMDAARNSKQLLARHHFSQKELMNMSGKQMIRKLKTEKNVNYDDCPGFFKSGTLLKKQQIEKEAVDFFTKQPIKAIRTITVFADFDTVSEFSTETAELLMCKHVNAFPEVMTKFSPLQIPSEEPEERSQPAA